MRLIAKGQRGGLALYPILLRYSTISGIANWLSLPPEARTASRVAAFD